ncbi:DUF424 family protein [Candidatus Woesearchaeota archaeon]|nr:MAG: DUF424 family protein [Candidatus Woesearchaeota archaeon]
MSLTVKVHTKQDRTIVAVCDSSLLGQVLEENGVRLDLSGDFYNGEVRDRSEVGDLVRNADGVNLVGESAVRVGIEEGVIDEGHIIKVQGVPHAQAVIVQE